MLLCSCYVSVQVRGLQRRQWRACHVAAAALLAVPQVRGAMPGQAYDSAPEVGPKQPARLQGMARLGFAYTRNAIILPSQQPGQLLFVGVVLWQLPQGAPPAALAADAASGMLPPQAWTVLLWSVNRCGGSWCGRHLHAPCLICTLRSAATASAAASMAAWQPRQRSCPCAPEAFCRCTRNVGSCSRSSRGVGWLCRLWVLACAAPGSLLAMFPPHVLQLNYCACVAVPQLRADAA